MAPKVTLNGVLVTVASCLAVALFLYVVAVVSEYVTAHFDEQASDLSETANGAGALFQTPGNLPESIPGGLQPQPGLGDDYEPHADVLGSVPRDEASAYHIDQFIPGYSLANISVPFGFESGSIERDEMMSRAQANPRVSIYRKTAEPPNALPMKAVHCWRDDEDTVHCIPTRFLAGFPKCGTTDMFYQLMKHPSTMFCKRKEVHSFRHKKTPKIYGSWFLKMSDMVAKAAPGYDYRFPIDGSASTAWDWNSQNPAPLILKQYAPDAKLIFMVREPVARMWSDYCYFTRKPLSAEGFHARVEKGLNNIGRCVQEEKPANPCMCMSEFRTKYAEKKQARVSLGAYSCHLRAWQSFYSQTSIKVIPLETMMENQANVMRSALNFLELNYSDPFESSPWWPSMAHVPQSVHANTAPSRCSNLTMLPETADLLNRFYAPLNDDLYRLYGIDYNSMS